MQNNLSFMRIVSISFIATWSAFAFAQTPHTHRHSFADAEKWKAVFDDPARDAWQKPHEVIRALALKPDAAVADLGAGTGYFSVRLAHVVPQGRVYAVDLEPGMVKHLTARVKEAGIANVSVVQGGPDDPRLPAKVGLVLLVDVYHHIGEREKYFNRLRAALNPGGRVAVIDFTDASPVGPPRSARVAAASVKEEMRRAGYALVQEHGFLPNQYFLVFAPTGS